MTAASIPASNPKGPAQPGRPAPAPATDGMAFKDAFVKASDFAAKNCSPDFKPVMAFGDNAFNATGAAQPVTWRFNMVGHLAGSSDWSATKVEVKPDGTVIFDPQWGGAAPDNLEMHTMPVLDVPNIISPDQGMAQVMQQNARQYKPQTPVSWEVGYNDRLDQVVETYHWQGKDTRDGTLAYCEESINPTTGAVVENDADPT